MGGVTGRHRRPLAWNGSGSVDSHGEVAAFDHGTRTNPRGNRRHSQPDYCSLITAAIEPGVFSVVVNQNAMKSLSYLFDKPVPVRSAPGLFCLDPY